MASYIIKPFRNNGHLTRTQRRYNFHLSSARAAIERAFELLKGRFRRLLLLDTKSIKTAVDTIIACCIFNNICVINDDIVDQYIVDGREDGNNPGVHELYGENDEDEAGLQKQLRVACFSRFDFKMKTEKTQHSQYAANYIIVINLVTNFVFNN